MCQVRSWEERKVQMYHIAGRIVHASNRANVKEVNCNNFRQGKHDNQLLYYPRALKGHFELKSTLEFKVNATA